VFIEAPTCEREVENNLRKTADRGSDGPSLILERRQTEAPGNDPQGKLCGRRNAPRMYLQNSASATRTAGYKKWYTDRERSLVIEQDLAQGTAGFGEQLQARRSPRRYSPPQAEPEPEYELRRVTRSRGRTEPSHFEKLPVTTQVYELECGERQCPAVAWRRKEIDG